jgi:predicted dehydrogenase
MMEIGVIGAGAMGKNHIRVYSEMKGVEQVTVFDLDHKAAEEVGKKFDADIAPSLLKLLDSVDAISICVPTGVHHKVAREAIDHGVHMLIEKPICRTASEAEQLVREIPDDLIVGVGHIERFNPIVSEIQKILNKPLYIELKRHNPASARISDSSVVEDLMIHDIDIVFHAFCKSDYSVQCMGNDDICSVLLEFDHVPVHLSASRKSSKKIRSIYIEEEDRTIEGDFMAQEIFVHRKPGQYSLENDRYVQENIIEKVLVNKVEPLKVELKTFVDCVKMGTPFPISPLQGLKNLQVCEEIRGMCKP